MAPTTWPQDLFQYNNLNQGLMNDPVDMWAAINTEYYNCVYQRVFKVGLAGFYGAGNGSTAESGGWYNNDFKLNANFSINCTKWIPKTIVYEVIRPAPHPVDCGLLSCPCTLVARQWVLPRCLPGFRSHWTIIMRMRRLVEEWRVAPFRSLGLCYYYHRPSDQLSFLMIR